MTRDFYLNNEVFQLKMNDQIILLAYSTIRRKHIRMGQSKIGCLMGSGKVSHYNNLTER